jgi:3-oxoacyl-[acyl-carrier protein] reductase
MLLQGKNAIVYGTGAIGRAAATGFAREGAKVHVAGRNSAGLAKLAADIRSAGGQVETAQVDAVDAHADAVAAESGSVDISFNLISYGDVQGTPLAQMSLDDFERPIVTATRTMFLTTRAAARHMMKQRSGVILTFGGLGDPMRDYYIGGFQVALGTIDTFRKQLAAELGRYGVRVVTLLTGGVPDSIPEGFEGRDAIVDMLVEPTMLKRTASSADVADVAAFAASDRARTMTGTSINITCGAIVT